MKISKRLIINILVLIIFLVLTMQVITSGNLVSLDKSLNAIIPTIQTNTFTFFSSMIGIIFDTLPMIFIALIIAFIIFWKDSKKDSIFFALTIIANALFIFVLKEVIQRARPINALISESSFSFPSGHATTAVVFFGFLAYLILKKNKSKKIKTITLIIAIIMIILIGFTRLYLNVHWLTDVLAGFSLGAFILTLGILFREKYYKNNY